MTSSVSVPTDLMQKLLAGFVAGQAARTLSSIAMPRDRSEVLHPGDLFGDVFAWVWEHDRDQAMILLADYLAELRVHGPGAPDVDPPISLDEVLDGLRIALPDGFTEYEQVEEAAREQVPSFYGDESI